MAELKIDLETGEIIQTAVMVKMDKAPAIVLDINEVKTFHREPEKLVDKVRDQAGFAVFDVSTERGRSECRSHAANIIRCISPAINASKTLAEEAKLVVKQDLAFRKVFEQGVREIAAFHRKPLDEYEAEQERIKEEERVAEEARLAEKQYLIDWLDAIDYNELYTLRRIKDEADRKEAEARRTAEENERLERELAARMEVERKRIQAEEEAKAKAEQERVLEAERAKIRVVQRKALAELDQERSLDAVRVKIRAEEAARAILSRGEQELIEDMLELSEPDNTGVTDTVTITREEYYQLLRDSSLLEALKFVGVENWGGYSGAVSILDIA